MIKNDGAFLEKIVQVIEQSIAPDSVVRRNVQLPILDSKSGKTAQCDVVIITGKPPRQTITIVEVQDRQTPVEINEFRGWTQKLQDVGAQHLYCVSRHPFPESIREKAASSGHTIKLITLKQLLKEQIPFNFFQSIFIYHDVDVTHVRKTETVFPTLLNDASIEKLEMVEEDLKSLKTNDPKFSYDKKTLIALSSLCINHVSGEKDTPSRTDSLDLGFGEHPLFYYVGHEFIPICLRIEFTWNSTRNEIPYVTLSYEQDDHGSLAWILESFYQSTRGPIWIKLPVVPTADGYSISGMFITLPVNVDFTFQLEKISPADKIVG